MLLTQSQEPVAVGSEAQHRLTKRPVSLINRGVLGRCWSSRLVVRRSWIGVLRSSSQAKGLR